MDEQDRFDSIVGLIFILLFPILGFFITGTLEGAWQAFLLMFVVIIFGIIVYICIFVVFLPIIIPFVAIQGFRDKKRSQKMAERVEKEHLEWKREYEQLEEAKTNLRELHLADEIDLEEYKNRLVALFKSSDSMRYSQIVTNEYGEKVIETGIKKRDVDREIISVKVAKEHDKERVALATLNLDEEELIEQTLLLFKKHMEEIQTMYDDLPKINHSEKYELIM